jgi:endogenous inhibitor of DNA gyrase (YacG/DUF329 family)
MAEQECPKCGATVSAKDGWANSAVSTLFMIGPAVHDMATQVRCPQCQHLFTESEVRYRRASWPRGWAVAIRLLGVTLLVSAAYHLLWAEPRARAVSITRGPA